MEIYRLLYKLGLNIFFYLKEISKTVLANAKIVFVAVGLITLIQSSSLLAVEQQPTITFLDPLIQGGLVHGKVTPGTQIEILGKEVYVNSKGEFIFGIGRDVPPKIEISLTVNAISQNLAYDVQQRQYTTQRIDGVEKKYVTPPKSVQARIKREAAQVWQSRQHLRKQEDFKKGFIWPLNGKVTGVYGSQRIFNGVPKRPHYGLDIAGPIGKIIIAPAPGKVRLAYPDMYYSGGTLVVDHGYGLTSTFIHLNKIYVKEGQVIQQGQEIAEVGATGRVTGPHLDWRMNWYNQRLDPMLVLPQKNSP